MSEFFTKKINKLCHTTLGVERVPESHFNA